MQSLDFTSFCWDIDIYLFEGFWLDHPHGWNHVDNHTGEDYLCVALIPTVAPLNLGYGFGVMTLDPNNCKVSTLIKYV